ncbi:MAG TPA: N-acetyltransferase [Rhizomicrobium sp.]|nr:N-acetyltransferase [Rhizomicrobium sp.]
MREGAKEAAWTIRAETPDDAAPIAALVERGFGPGRYAKSAYRLREGVDQVAALGFVAVENGVLRGSVRFWPVAVGPRTVLLLGPLAVETAQRGRGIGVQLMETGIAAARGAGWPAIVLVGDEPYYARVGFSKLPPGRVRFPGPVDSSRILGLSLSAGALLNLSGEVRRPHLDDPVCAGGAGLAAQ